MFMPFNSTKRQRRRQRVSQLRGAQQLMLGGGMLMSYRLPCCCTSTKQHAGSHGLVNVRTLDLARHTEKG